MKIEDQKAAEKLKNIRIKNGYSAKDLADNLGWKPQKIYDLERGLIAVKVKILTEYSKIFPEDIENEFLGKFPKINAGFMNKIGSIVQKVEKSNNSEILKPETNKNHGSYLKESTYPIPIYDVHASAGTGTLVENEQRHGSIQLSETYIRQELGINPKNLSMLYVTGDSMMPTLQPNDPILIDRSINNVVSDGIYVLRVGDALHVKRLQSQINKSVKVISDNKEYDSYFLDEKTIDEVKIIGRVVLNVKKL